MSRYARGEAVVTGVPASPGVAGAVGVSPADVQLLRERIEGLEAAVSALLAEADAVADQ